MLPTRPLITADGKVEFPKLSPEVVHEVYLGTGGDVIRFYYTLTKGKGELDPEDLRAKGSWLVAVPGVGSCEVLASRGSITPDHLIDSHTVSHLDAHPGAGNLADLINHQLFARLAQPEWDLYGNYLAEHCDGVEFFGECPACGEGTNFADFSSDQRVYHCVNYCTQTDLAKSAETL